jgi:hypothetical protein
METIDVDGNYLIIEKMMLDESVETYEFALKSCVYLTSSESFVIIDLSQIQPSFVINFRDIRNYSNFDGINYTLTTLTAFLRITTGSK